MAFKLGFGTGFAAGYYLGAKAGRQRYDQINRTLRKLRRSEAFETATEKAKTVVGEGVDKAKSAVGEGVDKAKGVVESKVGNGKSDELPPPRFS